MSAPGGSEQADDYHSLTSESIERFRASISRFSLPTSTRVRISGPVSLKVSPGAPRSVNAHPRQHTSSTIAQIQPTEDEDDVSPPHKRARRARGYASPERYAHLSGIDDHLGQDLNILFCGINPGCMSATEGHHYANPSNHFWRCLHQSGFTDRLLDPSEDSILPGQYNIGLTNIVSRPSAEAAELSRREMSEAVPGLLDKIVWCHPKAVCFVGKTIWDSVAPVLYRLINKKLPQQFNFGLQPVSILPVKTTGDTNDKNVQSHIQNILIFVVPSTSARVVKYQLRDKVEIFSNVHKTLTQAKTEKFESEHSVVPWPSPT